MLEHRELTERIIGLAIEVHRQTGPGLLESVYPASAAFELEHAGISLPRQVGVPVLYEGMRIPLGFRADILVADTIVVEIKGGFRLAAAARGSVADLSAHERPARRAVAELPRDSS